MMLKKPKKSLVTINSKAFRRFFTTTSQCAVSSTKKWAVALHNIEQEAERGITRYLNNLYEVQNKDKTLFDFVEYDSEVERDFAKACDSDERIKFYCKLPAIFKIDTPWGAEQIVFVEVTCLNEVRYYLIQAVWLLSVGFEYLI